MFYNVLSVSVPDQPTQLPGKRILGPGSRRGISRIAIATVFTASAALLHAQHTVRPGDIGEGARLYKSNCVLCHGLSGNSVAGIDLRRGKFRRMESDQDFVTIVRDGVKGTAMPSHNFSSQQAANILLYLRTDDTLVAGALASGDVALGRAIFEGKGGCLNCHEVNGKGEKVGPYLDEIGGIRTPAELEKSLLDPNADVLPEFRHFRGVTRNGVSISGKPLNEDTFSVQILDSSGRLISIMKSSLREHNFVNNSPMPSYRDKLSAEEVAALVSYLSSLTGL